MLRTHAVQRRSQSISLEPTRSVRPTPRGAYHAGYLCSRVAVVPDEKRPRARRACRGYSVRGLAAYHVLRRGSVGGAPVDAPGATFGEAASTSSPRSMGTSAPKVNIPGVGPVSSQQVQAARARAQLVIDEALGPADLSHLTPADAQRAQARLDAIRAANRLTDQQYLALTEGLAALTQSFPG
jgi:hypothetical protein